MIEAEAEVEVPFHDLDPMGVVWHGYYVKYLELARCKLLDKIQYNYPEMVQSGYSWPVIDLRLRYPQPARFQQVLKIRARLIEWENRLKIEYLIVDAKTGKRISRGYTVQVAVDMSSGEMCLESPACLLDKINKMSGDIGDD